MTGVALFLGLDLPVRERIGDGRGDGPVADLALELCQGTSRALGLESVRDGVADEIVERAGRGRGLVAGPVLLQEARLRQGRVGSGHIQTLTSAPGNPKARYFRNDDLPATAEDWLETAEEKSGSWWPEWLAWLEARSDTTKPAPKQAGSKAYPPLCDAPGTYVTEPAVRD